ncbi:MAG: hypothetical protein RL357_982 [Pseudomonadota bacterium]|jgi:hypothetical protein
MNTMSAFKLGLLSMAMLAMPAANAETRPAAEQDPEIQLMAIRQALAGAVEQAPTRVLSTAWIDQQGTLHETTVYNTDAVVKGVRVLAYINNGQETREQQIARVAADVRLPHSLKPSADNSTCQSTALVPRMAVALNYRVRAGSGELDAAVAAWLNQEVRQLNGVLTEQSTRWYANASGGRPPAQTEGAYWTSLLGSVRESTEWQLDVSIERINTPATLEASTQGETPLFLREWMSHREPQQWRLQLSLLQAGQAPIWDWRTQLENVPQDNAHAAVDILKKLKEQFGQAVADLDKQTSCTPIRYAIQPTKNDTEWVLTAGDQSHLKAGDRLLVLDKQSVPARLLEPHAMQRVALAEVVKVGPQHTELRQLAGAPLPRQGQWVAVPL